MDLARPRSGEQVLDVACGTGIVAGIAAARVGLTGSLVGVDLNPGTEHRQTRSSQKSNDKPDQRPHHYFFFALGVAFAGGGAALADAAPLVGAAVRAAMLLRLFQRPD